MNHVRNATVAVAAILLIAASAASAEVSQDRTNATTLGEVSMPREIIADDNGEANITANVTVNVSVAKDAGAHWILVGVGNDDATDLTVNLGSLEDAEDNGTIEAEMTEGDGTYRAQWWVDVDSLPDTAHLLVDARVQSPESVDVETLVMAFDANYTMLTDDTGADLLVQSYSNVIVTANLTDTEDEEDTDSANETEDENTGTGENEQETTRNRRTPGPGAVILGAIVAGTALAVTRDRRG